MGSQQRPQNAEGPVRNIWTIAWDAGEGREQGGGLFPLPCQPWDRALYAEHHRESQRSVEGEGYHLCPPNRKPQFPSLRDSLVVV